MKRELTLGDIAIQYIAVCGDVGDEDGGAVVCDDCYVGCCGVWKHIDNTTCVSIQGRPWRMTTTKAC